jgi:hypothetical protein
MPSKPLILPIMAVYRKEEKTRVLRPGWWGCRWIGLYTLAGACSTCAPVPASSSRRALREAADHEAGRGRRNHQTKSTLALVRHALSSHILPYFSTLAGENSSADHGNVVSRAGLSILPIPCVHYPRTFSTDLDVLFCQTRDQLLCGVATPHKAMTATEGNSRQM